MIRKKISYFHIFIFIYILITLLELEPAYLNPDGINYYSYVRSYFLDGDLLFLNEFKRLGIVDEYLHLTPTGYVGNVLPVGCSFLWAPFFIIGHFITVLAGILYNFYPADGFSAPYFLMINFGTSLYGVIGIYMSFLIAKKLTGDIHAVLAAIFISVGTPFFYYMYQEPNMPHVLEASTVCLFCYIWYQTKENRSFQQWILLGMVAGIMMLVRTQTGVYLILPFIDLLIEFRNKKTYWKSILKGSLFLFTVLILFSPQMIIWKIFYGNFIAAREAMTLNLSESNISPLLFSPYHGLYFWSPILIISTLGIYYLYCMDRMLAICLFIVFILQIYINSICTAWWQGAAFGSRQFLNCTFFFVLSLSCFFSRFHKHRCFFLPGFLFVLWSILLYFQTTGGLINLNNFYTYQEIITKQIYVLKNITSIFFIDFLKVQIPLKLLLTFLLPILLISSVGLNKIKTWCENNIIYKRLGQTIIILYLAFFISLPYILNKTKSQLIEHDTELKKILCTEKDMEDKIMVRLLLDEAWYYEKLGKWQSALRSCEKAMKNNPTNPDLFNRLAYIYINLGRYQEAKEKLEYLINNYTKTPAIYNNLAVVYSLLNQNKKAKEMWKKSLSLMNKNQIKDIE